MSQEGIIDAGTERLIDEAQQIGERAGLQNSVAAARTLEVAFAKSLADLIHFGADEQDRLEIAIVTLRENLIKEVRAQVFLRRGRKGRPG